jgi:hypothetical protein
MPSDTSVRIAPEPGFSVVSLAEGMSVVEPRAPDSLVEHSRLARDDGPTGTTAGDAQSVPGWTTVARRTSARSTDTPASSTRRA